MKKTTTKSKPLASNKSNESNQSNKSTFIPSTKAIKEVAQAITKKVSGNDLVFNDALPLAKVKIADGLQQLTACVAMKNLEPIQVREIFDYSKSVEDAVKEAAGFARARVLELALRTGEATGGTGESRKLTYPDGRVTLVKAQKVGVDPKKFEAALRAKSVEVTKYMVPDIKYKMPSDYDAAKQAVDDRIFTEDEVKTFSYDQSYAVERSKEGKVE